MVTFKALLLELLILANYYWYKTQSEAITYKIGALLSNETVVSHFSNTTEATTVKTSYNLTIKFQPLGLVMDSNSMQTGYQVCELVKRSGGNLSAIIVSHPKDDILAAPLTATFTAAFFDIPVIGISARQSAFSDKNIHGNFLRTVTPYSQEGSVFIRMIKNFGWKHINVIYSDDHEGKTLLSVLEERADDGYTIRMKVALKEGADYEKALRPMSIEQTRVVILYCQREMARQVYDMAKKLGMLQQHWAWMVTEPALLAPNVPAGVLGVKLSAPNEYQNMEDAVKVITEGMLDALEKKRTTFYSRYRGQAKLSRYDCDSQSTTSSRYSTNYALKALLPFIRNVDIYRAGDRSPITFDEKGDRQQATYVIVNQRLNGEQAPVGQYVTRSYPSDDGTEIEPLQIVLKKILWPPGNQQYKKKVEECQQQGEHKVCHKKTVRMKLMAPKSFKKKTHLKVVTKKDIPFVYTRKLKAGESCDTHSDPSRSKKEVECTHTDPQTDVVTKYCCRGYCIDLLRRLANRTRNDEPVSSDMENSFTYDLHLVGDDKIGDLEKGPDGQEKWTGIVEEIYQGKADLGIAPMAITPERATRIEFTKPFKYLGLTILVKREKSHPKSNLASFLQPFANTLWVLVFLSVHVVALVLYLLDRFSPFGRYKFARGADAEEDALNLSSAMWFAWGVLLNSGIGEGTPRSFSARVLGMVWAGFAMIIVASYTANLAAFLVLDRPEALLSGIDDARLRNPQKDFKFATVKGSHVEAYFKSQLEYDTMLRYMTKNVYLTAEDAIDAVKSDELKAFIWDSTRLEFEAASECDLKTAGEVFGRTGYGLAMRKDSPWLYEISQAVLNFHERGVMETLDSQWILVKAKGCPSTDTSPATLGLTNMAGVFIMVAAGIVVGVFLIFIEMAYKKRTGLKEKELELARNAADRWRGNIEKRKILRKTMAAERLEKHMPLIGSGGVSTFPPHLSFNNPTYGRPRDSCQKRVVHLTNQNGIFAEQPSIDRV